MTEYLNLIIRQYHKKPKAEAEIQLRAKQWGELTDLLLSIPEAFDIDKADTAQLDVIGRIVVLPRTVNEGLLPDVFGFSENPEAKGFGDKFNLLRTGGPFYNKFTKLFTEFQLNNAQYRRFLKAKIALNMCSGTLTTEDGKLSAQDAVFTAFDGKAYIVDNQNMSVTLYVSPSVNPAELRLILAMGLLPRVGGVTYKIVIQSEPGLTFGFKENPNSLGFGRKVIAYEPFWANNTFGGGSNVFEFNKFGPSGNFVVEGGGVFARKLIW